MAGIAIYQPDPITVEQASNSLLTNTRCCFCFPRFTSNRSSSPSVALAWWQRVSSSCAQSHDGFTTNTWWSRSVQAFKKIREWSEIFAGPKWKTFIRRFNRNSRRVRFQYDPLSYALNFDEGPGGAQSTDFESADDYGGFHDFSSRYSSASTRAS